MAIKEVLLNLSAFSPSLSTVVRNRLHQGNMSKTPDTGPDWLESHADFEVGPVTNPRRPHPYQYRLHSDPLLRDATQYRCVVCGRSPLHTVHDSISLWH